MRATAIIRITVAIAIGLCTLLSAAEDPSTLTPSGYVNDYAGVIDVHSADYLNHLCLEVEQKTQAQIAIVTVHSLDGSSPESYARSLFNRWGIGPKATNRGVLVLLAIDDHKYRIEVGTGLEAVVTDRKSAAFGQEIVPDLRQAAYGHALSTLARRIADALALDAHITINDPASQGSSPAVAQNQYIPQPASNSNIILFLMFALLVFLVLGVIYILRRQRAKIGSSQPADPSTDPDDTEEQDTSYTPYRHSPWPGYYNYSDPGITTLNIANYHAPITYSSTNKKDKGSGWSGGGGFGGGSLFSGFGGGSSSGGGSGKSWATAGSAIADVVSCLASFGGGSSSGGGASGSW